MSKRRPGLKPRERDEWPTPWLAAVPLLPHLAPHTRSIEPCCNDGQLVGHLEREGHICVGAYDLPIDARTARYATDSDVVFITNLPWRRQFENIANLSDQRPLWGLVYSDWLFTSRAAPYLARLRAIAVVGRVEWMPGTKTNGMDNCCWCLFDRPRPGGGVESRFYPRLSRADSLRVVSTRRAA